MLGLGITNDVGVSLTSSHGQSKGFIPPLAGDAGSVSLIPVDSERQTQDFGWRDATPNVRTRVGDGAPGVPAGTGREIPDGQSLARRLASLLQLPQGLLASGGGPLEWPGVLLPYQLDGVSALLSRDVLLLADDMGLGKTIQAIAALRILAMQRRIQRALIVAPASLLVQWRRELRAWAPELRISTVHGTPVERSHQWIAPAHVYLTTYETLRSDFTDNIASPPRRHVWDVVVLDEAQKIKSHQAEVSQKCKLVPRKRAWALTGTPLENRVEDLVSIMEFLTPLGPTETLRPLHPRDAMDKHAHIQLRRKKSQVLPQLPPKMVSNIHLELTGAQWGAYKEAEDRGISEIRDLGENAGVENVLALIVRLKQICNFCPTTGESAKLSDMQEKLATLHDEGHRALIFSQFTDARFGVSAIASRLSAFRPLRFTGDLSQGERQRVIQDFKDDVSHTVLVLSLRAGGQGLNLQEASYVFHFDRWWNPAVERQAEDRSHRLGQIRQVHVYKYTCVGTIEERIEQVLARKHQLFQEVVDDVSIDLRANLSFQELFGLFGLQPPKGAGTGWMSPIPLPDFASMTGSAFERFVEDALGLRGWSVSRTPASHDGGVDVVARKHLDVGGGITLYIQCKNQGAPVGVEVARALNGSLPKLLTGVRGVIASPSGFTSDARAFSSERGIILWGRGELLDLVNTQPVLPPSGKAGT